MSRELDDPQLSDALEYLLREAFLKKWGISSKSRAAFTVALRHAHYLGRRLRHEAASLGMKGSGEPFKLSRQDVVDLRDAAETVIRVLENDGLLEWLWQAELLGQEHGAPPIEIDPELLGNPIDTMKRWRWIAEQALKIDGRTIEASMRKKRATAQVDAASKVLWVFFRLLPGRTGAIAKKSSNQGGGYSAAVEFVTECVQNLFPDDERAREEATIYAVLKPAWDERRKH
jgi:hypothetical protein